MPNLKVEQAFELADASAERSAAACTVRLAKEPVIEYTRSNVALLKWMAANGYQDRHTLERRIAAMEAWLAHPKLIEPDADAQYAAVFEIDMSEVKEPIVACPNDPDDVKLLSARGRREDRRGVHRQLHDQHRPFPRCGNVLDGRDATCRRGCGSRRRPDGRSELLREEGYYGILGPVPARASRCPAARCAWATRRSAQPCHGMSTSTRNFPNRLGIDTRVYLGSAELAAVCALLGRIPTGAEYMEQMKAVSSKAGGIYRYMKLRPNRRVS